MDEIEQDLRGLKTGFFVSQGVGLILVVLVSIWTGHYLGGFAGPSQPDREFNWHPLLMTVSLIYLYGTGILLYRVFRNEKKRTLKLAHAIVLGSATILACLGLKAVFDAHSYSRPPIPHLYSLHSWIGFATVALAVAQWILGLVAFLCPGLASHLRMMYLPVHTTLGAGIFVLASVAALLGITEKAIWTLGKKWQVSSGEGTLVNMIGVFIILFTGLVMILVSKLSFRRLNRPEDQMLLAETNHE
ncbi:cytochrome b561 [Eurytemora carolleeae]|uniref:cytochrome b561 n=1 Tax=Eurytemora carolleeae TaxID=1294199 RepID=UPI000C793F6F|nr:cytochrome b561 [Eurytemora carolleeae]|eukprot:XP_023333056.1 cytochrome b561-like [Eurytemora affinis]